MRNLKKYNIKQMLPIIDGAVSKFGGHYEDHFDEFSYLFTFPKEVNVNLEMIMQRMKEYGSRDANIYNVTDNSLEFSTGTENDCYMRITFKKCYDYHFKTREGYYIYLTPLRKRRLRKIAE